MRIQMKLGRFSTKAHEDFFRALHAAYKKSRVATAAEIAVRQIEDSLANDIQAYAKSHEHGNDVMSIAKAKIEAVRVRITDEKKAKEAEMIRAEIEALDQLMRDRMRRLQELEGERGMGDRRLVEIAEARERRAARMIS